MEDKEKGELQSEKLHNLLFSSDVVTMIQSRTVFITRDTGYLRANFLYTNLKERNDLPRIGREAEQNIKIILKQAGSVYAIY